MGFVPLGYGCWLEKQPENPIDEVVPAQPGKFLETAKGLQLLQEIERKNADNAGDEVEELDSSDSDNDQHS